MDSAIIVCLCYYLASIKKTDGLSVQFFLMVQQSCIVATLCLSPGHCNRMSVVTTHVMQFLLSTGLLLGLAHVLPSLFPQPEKRVRESKLYSTVHKSGKSAKSSSSKGWCFCLDLISFKRQSPLR